MCFELVRVFNIWILESLETLLDCLNELLTKHMVQPETVGAPVFGDSRSFIRVVEFDMEIMLFGGFIVWNWKDGNILIFFFNLEGVSPPSSSSHRWNLPGSLLRKA